MAEEIQHTGIGAALSVDVVMRLWPKTIHVFLASRMLCVGCPIGPFHSVAEVCAVHALNLPRFLRELESVVCDVSGHPDDRSPSAKRSNL